MVLLIQVLVNILYVLERLVESSHLLLHLVVLFTELGENWSVKYVVLHEVILVVILL